jgi:hypothetical protein
MAGMLQQLPSCHVRLGSATFGDFLVESWEAGLQGTRLEAQVPALTQDEES